MIPETNNSTDAADDSPASSRTENIPETPERDDPLALAQECGCTHVDLIPVPVAEDASLPSIPTEAPGQGGDDSSTPADVETPEMIVPRAPAPPDIPTHSQVKLSPAPQTVERLPVNLTVGKPANLSADQLFREPRGVWQFALTNVRELGLEYDETTGGLHGTPVKSGELELHLQLSHPEAVGRQKSILTRVILVTVNPDPESLWKNLPSNSSDPYHKPDTDKAHICTREAQLFGASIRGRSHAHEGLFRDDDFSLALHEPSDWHLLVAADWAGSAKYSRRGSQIACAKTLTKLREWMNDCGPELEMAAQAAFDAQDHRPLRKLAYLGLAGAAMEARKAIHLEASCLTPPAALKDFATTLLLAVARKFPKGWIVLTFAIGDGGICLLAGDGKPTVMCTPDSGEFSGQTLFLTAGNVFNDASALSGRIHVQVVPEFKALLLMTDGVTDPKFPTEASLGDRAIWESFWADLVASVDFREENVGSVSQLLNWLSFRSPGNHDDRTIALLLPRHPTVDIT